MGGRAVLAGGRPALAGGAILAEVIVAIGLTTGGSLSTRRDRAPFGSPASIGTLFLTDHLIAFEVTSIVLLVAAVGGVVLGSHARNRASMQPLRSGPVEGATGADARA